MKTFNIDFVVASSENYTGFLSTNVKHPIHGYAPRPSKEVGEFLQENWPGCTTASDNMFDDLPNRRGYTERDKIFTNKIETRLKELEESRKIFMYRQLNKSLDK